MKKVQLFALIMFSGLLITSCKSDDDGGSSINTDELIGTWRLVEETYNGEVEQLNACDLLTKLEFDASTATQTFYYGTDCASTDINNEAYVVSGDKIITSDVDGSYEVEITTLNTSILKIKDVDEYTENGEQFTDVYTYTYERQ